MKQTLLVLLILCNLCLGASAANSYSPALEGVGIEQRIGNTVPLDLVFRNESGKEIKLAECFKQRPVVLMLVYYRCPMLCNMTLNQMARCLNALTESAGKDFDIVTVSFDPRETPELAAQKKATYMKFYRRPSAAEGWHFLTGSEASISALTSAVGFGYRWDADNEQFAHAMAVMLLTPDGKISRYFLDLDLPPTEIRNAIKAASNGSVGPNVDPDFLYCFHYDPSSSKYGLIISRTMQCLALIMLISLSGFVMFNVRRERRLAKG